MHGNPYCDLGSSPISQLAHLNTRNTLFKAPWIYLHIPTQTSLYQSPYISVTTSTVQTKHVPLDVLAACPNEHGRRPHAQLHSYPAKSKGHRPGGVCHHNQHLQHARNTPRGCREGGSPAALRFKLALNSEGLWVAAPVGRAAEGPASMPSLLLSGWEAALA